MGTTRSLDSLPPTAISALPVAVLRSDGKGKVVYANLTAMSLFGDDVVGRFVRTVYDGRENSLPGPVQIREALASSKSRTLSRIAIQILKRGGGVQRILGYFKLDEDGESVDAVLVPGVYELHDAVSHIAGALTGGTDLDSVLLQIANEARDLCNADDVYVLVLDPDRDKLIVRANASTHGRDRTVIQEVSSHAGVAGQAYWSRATVRCDDLSAASLIADHPFPDAVSSVAAPILYVDADSSHQCYGVLLVDGLSPNQFSADTEYLLDILAKHAALGIAQIGLFHEQREDYLHIINELRKVQNVLAASTFVHEAKNIVREALDALDDVKSIELPRKTRTNLDDICDRLQNSNDILTQLLNRLIVKQRSNESESSDEPENEAVDLHRLVKGVARVMSFPRDLVKLEMYPASETCIVQAEPQKLRFMVFNLLQNAISAISRTGHGKKGTITISVARSPDPGFCRLVIEDDGPGMPGPFLNLVQHGVSVTRTPGGSGIGLIVVRETVLASKGKLDVQSKLGKYTRFTIDLPSV